MNYVSVVCAAAFCHTVSNIIGVILSLSLTQKLLFSFKGRQNFFADIKEYEKPY